MRRTKIESSLDTKFSLLEKSWYLIGVYIIKIIFIKKLSYFHTKVLLLTSLLLQYFFFTSAYFHFASHLQYFSFSHRHYDLFMFFGSSEIRLLSFYPLQLFLCYPRDVEKESALLLLFFTLKVRLAMRFSAKTNSRESSCIVVAFGC